MVCSRGFPFIWSASLCFDAASFSSNALLCAILTRCYKNNPLDDKKTILALSCFRLYLTNKLHMVWSVWIFLCKRLSKRNGLSMLNWKQDIVIIFKKTLYISRIKYTQESSFSFSFINNIHLLPIKNKNLISLIC